MPFFRSYKIDENDSNVKKTKIIPTNKLTDKFNPDYDAIDRRIYYGVTNQKIDPNEKFSDESNSEDESSKLMMSLQSSIVTLQRKSTFDPGANLRQSMYG